MLFTPAIIRHNAFLSESHKIFRAMTVPCTDARKKIIDDFNRGLKTDGLWTLLDTFYLLAAHDAQAARINWKNPGTFDLTVSGTPSFSTDQGYTGNGSDGLLTATGYNPSTAGLNFAQNSASLGCYVKTVGTVASAFVIGMNAARIAHDAGLTGYAFRLNDGGASTTYTFGTSTGHFTLRRTASASRELFRAGAQVATGAIASTTVATSLTLLGGSATFDNCLLSLGYTAGGLNDTQIANLNTRINTLRTAIGF